MLLVISLAQPMFMGRYIIAVVPAAAIAMSATLTSLRPRVAALVAGAVIVAALVGGLVSLYRFEGHRWSGAVAHIESDLTQDARHGIIFNFSHVRQPFEVNAVGSDVLVETEPVSPAEPWGTNLRYPAEVSDAELAQSPRRHRCAVVGRPAASTTCSRDRHQQWIVRVLRRRELVVSAHRTDALHAMRWSLKPRPIASMAETG
ncbi:MAG: hypothetical protein U5K29_04455 [Acidimicrobiales bacterium]|nr:hypothetical protein [Acidimicrobiales bacterium]